jgi:preprotein translocase subunit SecF
MSFAARLYRNETEFDFVGRKRIGFTISLVLLTLSLASLLVRGLNLGVDFEGGTVIEVTNSTGASVADIRDALRPFGLETATVQLTSSVDADGIRVESEIIEDLVERERVVTAVSEAAGVDATAANVTAVGPAFGEEITKSAVRALVIFLIVVALFIAWRFEWKMALAGLAALFHDLILTAGVYSLTGFEVTPSTVIAILTILGYSLYDTVVVFDKIVETVEISQGRRSLADHQRFDEHGAHALAQHVPHEPVAGRQPLVCGVLPAGRHHVAGICARVVRWRCRRYLLVDFRGVAATGDLESQRA